MARFHLRTPGGPSLHEGSPDEPALLGASKSLAVLAYLTRRAGTELWRANDGRLSLAEGKLEVDVWVLDGALEEKRCADAVEAYGGPFLAGFDGKAGSSSSSDRWRPATGWRRSAPTRPTAPSSARSWARSRAPSSLSARFLAGPVRVWRGERWRIGPAPAAGERGGE